MYNQHHEGIFPNHFFHPDQTIKDHTLDLHEELLEIYPKNEFVQAYQLKEINHHVNKKSEEDFFFNNHLLPGKRYIYIFFFYLIFNQSCQRQKVKQIGKHFPNICIAIFSQTLVIKTIHLSDLTRFMITAKNGNAILISNFKRN